MSKQAFEEFLRKLQQDAGLRQELQSRFARSEKGIPVDDLARFASGKGYRFSVQDLQGELSDEQLGAVSGGLLSSLGSTALLGSYNLDGTMYIKLDSFYKW